MLATGMAVFKERRSQHLYERAAGGVLAAYPVALNRQVEHVLDTAPSVTDAELDQLLDRLRAAERRLGRTRTFGSQQIWSL